MDINSQFLLLQINDALFPIGGYSHSYGLETYIQRDVVKDTNSAAEFIQKRLKYNSCYNELAFVRFAWDCAKQGNLVKLQELDEIADAGKTPREIREASQKLGSRFVKTVEKMGVNFISPIFTEYVESRKGEYTHHAVAYGVLCASAGIPLDDALKAFCYSTTSNLVVTCVKTIPLSQSDGQSILTGLYETFDEVIEKTKEISWKELGLSSPGFDLRCIQHEVLYSRLYMS
ncbi:MAG: urease accessory protein UreF [Clostridiales bacterium]|nr:urease accessory protein UreF [Clostridiales bacterium]MDU3489648.1 urease accessory protein UreF [Clostridiales bacterium]